MNANEITVVQNKNEVGQVFDYEAKALEYLESMGSKLPKKQQTQFLELAKAFQLNPFKREIYAVGYGENWNIITGYEVYLKRAERCGNLDGWNCEVVGSGESMKATVTIHRKDWAHPFTHTVLFSECTQKTKDGKLNSIWSKMPSFMLKKVAIAQGFRMCFPDEFSGMPYIADEMPNEEQLKEINITKTATATKRGELKDAPLPPSYTKEQAEECGSLLHTLNADGNPYFTETEIAEWRQYLIDNGGDKTLEELKKALQEKVDA